MVKKNVVRRAAIGAVMAAMTVGLALGSPMAAYAKTSGLGTSGNMPTVTNENLTIEQKVFGLNGTWSYAENVGNQPSPVLVDQGNNTWVLAMYQGTTVVLGTAQTFGASFVPVLATAVNAQAPVAVNEAGVVVAGISAGVTANIISLMDTATNSIATAQPITLVVNVIPAAPSAGNDTLTVSDELYPYPLYKIQYDNMGYPYFYGKWGGSANMDADNMAKTDACMKEMGIYVSKNFAPKPKPNTTTSFAHDISWKLIGTYSDMPIVVRYVNGYSTDYYVTYTRLPSPEERGVATAGNGIFEKK